MSGIKSEVPGSCLCRQSFNSSCPDRELYRGALYFSGVGLELDIVIISISWDVDQTKVYQTGVSVN